MEHSLYLSTECLSFTKRLFIFQAQNLNLPPKSYVGNVTILWNINQNSDEETGLRGINPPVKYTSNVNSVKCFSMFCMPITFLEGLRVLIRVEHCTHI